MSQRYWSVSIRGDSSEQVAARGFIQVNLRMKPKLPLSPILKQKLEKREDSVEGPTRGAQESDPIKPNKGVCETCRYLV